MSWEAFRLTSKSPSELYHVLGPHGVDELIRHAMNSCWRAVPEDGRTYAAVLERVGQVFDRNMRVWRAIKKPAPEAFFQNLHSDEADGLFRQALVLCWMMLPRTGGRKFRDVATIVTAMYQRNLAAWDEDNTTFTKGPGRRKPRATPTKRPAKRKPKRRR
jgi:hypothetical protein